MTKAHGIPPEEFERAFGDDYWERPVEERFELLLKRMLSINPKEINETEHGQDQTVRRRSKSRD